MRDSHSRQPALRRWYTTLVGAIVLGALGTVLSMPAQAQASDSIAVIQQFVRRGDVLRVRVSGDSTIRGTFEFVDADRLTLLSPTGLATLRADLIRSIDERRPRKVAETALVTAASLGVLVAATVYLSYESGGTDLTRGQLARLFGSLGAATGAVVGVAIGLARSPWLRIYPVDRR